MLLGACAAAPPAGFSVIDILERTGFPDLMGRDWIFVRMHDAVMRCLSCMISHGQTIKPTSAINSAAVSPRVKSQDTEIAHGQGTGAAEVAQEDTSDAGSGAVILGLAPAVSNGGTVAVDILLDPQLPGPAAAAAEGAGDMQGDRLSLTAVAELGAGDGVHDVHADLVRDPELGAAETALGSSHGSAATSSGGLRQMGPAALGCWIP